MMKAKPEAQERDILERVELLSNMWLQEHPEDIVPWLVSYIEQDLLSQWSQPLCPCRLANLS